MKHKSKSITYNNNYFNTIVQNGKDKGTRKQVHFEEQLNDSIASSDAECPICGAIYGSEDDESIWICCDGCNSWFNIECTSLSQRKKIPDKYFCNSCLQD